MNLVLCATIESVTTLHKINFHISQSSLPFHSGFIVQCRTCRKTTSNIKVGNREAEN